MPRFAGDQLPAGKTGQILSLADKLDTLLGIFAIGQKPTGDKDPFALRRAALGVLRILIECNLDLDLHTLITYAAREYVYKIDTNKAIGEVVHFMLDRLKVYYTSQQVGVDVYDAVLALRPTRPIDFDRRIHAVNEFIKLDAAESLAAANKRIGNILKKIDGELPQLINLDLLQEKAEQHLHDELQRIAAEVTPKLQAGDYADALQQLAALREPVDAFFDQVMVMADDQALKHNRIALLSQLHGLFIRAADLSRLQPSSK
jgi:glycyl-tRNA synthetase beta chain